MDVPLTKQRPPIGKHHAGNSLLVTTFRFALRGTYDPLPPLAQILPDYPYDPGDWDAAKKVEQLDIPAADKLLMLAGNAKRLLKL